MLGDRFQGEAPALEEAVICDVCEEQIINSQWWRSYWGETFCQKHAFDGTPICSSCSRFKIRNIKFISLNDGRKLCPDCRSTAILDSESCRSLVSEMYNYYGGLNMHIRKDIPVLLVDQIEMNRLIQIPNRVVLGLTTCVMEPINCVKWSSQRGRNIEVVKQVEYLPRHCLVTGMLLLYGYPKLAIGRTLAHEMMHTWMRLEGYHGLELKVEEGMCELMAYKWLEWYGFFGEDMYGADEKPQFMRNFKEYLKNRMDGNDCRIYGDGFRDAKWAVERYGFEYTMNIIAHTGKLAIGATLAHEMMHTWMRLEGYHGLERKVEEGMGEVMAYKWLEWYGFLGENMDGADEEAQFLRNFKEHVKNKIEGNFYKIYGDGFRHAKWAVERYGFEYTIKNIDHTSKFPY